MDAADAPVAEFWRSLGLDERTRARRFRTAKDQRRFIVRRGTLRALLAPRLGCPPFQIRYTQNQFGKLSVAGSEIRFNVSRSYSLALFVLTQEIEVGCDVERVNPKFDFEAIVARYFGPKQVAAFRSVPTPLRRDWFYRHWTLREAYVKCSGTGLSVPPEIIDVPLTAEGALILLGTRSIAYAPLETLPGYHAALVADARSIQLRAETRSARAIFDSA